MFIITQENWRIVKKTNIIGSKYKTKIDKIEKGDKIIVYIKTPHCKIKGFFEVLSKYQEDGRLFKGGIFGNRLKLKPTQILKKPIEFRSLINKLNFIKNKKRWYLHLYGVRGVLKLSKKDFEFILNQ